LTKKIKKRNFGLFRFLRFFAGLGNGFEKNLGFRFFKNLKNLNNPNLGFLVFLVKFYTNHIKFHILIMICEYCYILQKML